MSRSSRDIEMRRGIDAAKRSKHQNRARSLGRVIAVPHSPRKHSNSNQMAGQKPRDLSLRICVFIGWRIGF